MASLLQKQATLNNLASLRRASVAALLIKRASATKFATTGTPKGGKGVKGKAEGANGAKGKAEGAKTTVKVVPGAKEKSPWYANPGVLMAGGGLGIGSLLLAYPEMGDEDLAEARRRYAEAHRDSIDHLFK